MIKLKKAQCVFARDLDFLFNEIIRIVIQMLLNDETLQR